MPPLPHYPSLTPTALQIAVSVIAGWRRSFREDSKAFIRRLRPPLRLLGEAPPPAAGGRVVLANHYQGPGFRAWWIPFAITTVLDEDVHWVMTSAWTYPDPLRSHLLTPLTRWLFRRVACCYSFTLMPPMPPAPREAAERAHAVREVLRFATAQARPLIGLVPEGGDAPEGRLMIPPPGVGRFISLLAARGLEVLPAGVFEADGAFCLRFARPIDGAFEASASPETRDRLAADRVMRAIASCLPDRLRGPYAERGSPYAPE
jgi:hypothetical protein